MKKRNFTRPNVNTRDQSTIDSIHDRIETKHLLQSKYDRHNNKPRTRKSFVMKFSLCRPLEFVLLFINRYTLVTRGRSRESVPSRNENRRVTRLFERNGRGSNKPESCIQSRNRNSPLIGGNQSGNQKRALFGEFRCVFEPAPSIKREQSGWWIVRSRKFLVLWVCTRRSSLFFHPFQTVLLLMSSASCSSSPPHANYNHGSSLRTHGRSRPKDLADAIEVARCFEMEIFNDCGQRCLRAFHDDTKLALKNGRGNCSVKGRGHGVRREID